MIEEKKKEFWNYWHKEMGFNEIWQWIEQAINEACKEQRMTSENWQKVKPDIIILDPDGWDRWGKRTGDVEKDWQYSWYEEVITEKEYNERLTISTVMLQYNKPLESK